MRTILMILLVTLLFGCEIEIENAKTEAIAVKYDSSKAIKYGADEYGMKKYILAYLKRGPNRNQDSVAATELQIAHLKNITRLAEEGTLVLAGPFLDDEEVRGIYFFDVETIEEAKALTETDPAIKAGRLEMELRPWYGTAALKEVNNIHKTLGKFSVSDN
jgi:uncharacterized protein